MENYAREGSHLSKRTQNRKPIRLMYIYANVDWGTQSTTGISRLVVDSTNEERESGAEEWTPGIRCSSQATRGRHSSQSCMSLYFSLPQDDTWRWRVFDHNVRSERHNKKQYRKQLRWRFRKSNSYRTERPPTLNLTLRIQPM